VPPGGLARLDALNDGAGNLLCKLGPMLAQPKKSAAQDGQCVSGGINMAVKVELPPLCLRDGESLWDFSVQLDRANDLDLFQA